MTQSFNEIIQISEFNEPYLYSINGHRFLHQRSTEIYHNTFDHSLFESDNFIIISGTDSGLLIDYILSLPLNPACKILFVEQPHIISMLESIPDEYAAQIKVCTLEQWTSVVDEMQIISYVYKSKVKLILSLAAQELHDCTYHLINSQLREEIELHIFKVGSELGNQDFVEQQLRNIGDNVVEAACLKNAFDGQACVVLAGGPSLDENIDWIKSQRDNLVVFAVSRLAKRLIEEQLYPDFVIAVDPKPISLVNSREMLLFPNQPTLIYASAAYSPIVAQWPHEKVYLGHKVPWDSKLNINNIDNTPPTVTNTAITMAMEMGFKLILLAGVDLCYNSVGVSHAKGNAESQGLTLLFERIGKQVETYAGDIVETNIQLLIAQESLSNQASIAAEKSIEIYNLSLNSAKTKYIPYKNSDDISLPIGNKEKRTKKDLMYVSHESHIKHNKLMLQEVLRIKREIKEIKDLSQKALKHNDAMFTAIESGKHKAKLDKIEHTLNKKYHSTSLFIRTYGIQYFVQCVQPSDMESWTDEQLHMTGATYYTAYIHSSELLLKQLNEIEYRLTIRIAEYTSSPNLKTLTNYWEENNELGRVLIFALNNKADIESSTENQHFINQASQAFLDTFKVPTTNEIVLAREPEQTKIKAKIELYFKYKNKAGIENIVNALSNYTSTSNSISSSTNLAKAYLNILNGNNSDALDILTSMNTNDLCLPELKQIVGISAQLNKFDITTKYLTLLSDIDLSFQPKLAKSLQLQGKITEAIDVYNQYLQLTPQDIETWKALGKLYNSIGVNEAAQIAFEQVLSIDPNDSEAKIFLNNDH